MVFRFLRASRFLRALVLTVLVGSFLVWTYIVLRVVFNGVDVHYPFVDSVPSVSISAMGAFSFGLGCISLFLYLWLWGRFDRRSLGLEAWDQREP